MNELYDMKVLTFFADMTKKLYIKRKVIENLL